MTFLLTYKLISLKFGVKIAILQMKQKTLVEK